MLWLKDECNYGNDDRSLGMDDTIPSEQSQSNTCGIGPRLNCGGCTANDRTPNYIKWHKQ